MRGRIRLPVWTPRIAGGVIVALVAAGLAVDAQVPAGSRQAGAGGPLAMGTTTGQQYARLVIHNAMIVSGRGEPGTNRGMPPEGPVDILIENGRIRTIVPLDPVNTASGRGGQRLDGDRVIDATGMYVIPGLVEMHAHLPPRGSARQTPASSLGGSTRYDSSQPTIPQNVTVPAHRCVVHVMPAVAARPAK